MHTHTHTRRDTHRHTHRDTQREKENGFYKHYLGGGSFGDVLKANHTDHGDVAVKVASDEK